LAATLPTARRSFTAECLRCCDAADDDRRQCEEAGFEQDPEPEEAGAESDGAQHADLLSTRAVGPFRRCIRYRILLEWTT
jgi:hypothetical protein